MIGFPFDSVVTFDEHGYPIFDRAVSSKPLKSLIAKLFTTGVMPNPSNNLQVFAGEEGMTVTVKAGFCVIEGGLKLEDTDRTLEIQASDTTYDRIDTVVMRWNGNDNARVCDLYVLEGTPAASPVRPELTREGSIYEIGLADIFIPKNTGAIAQQRITDTRLDNARCGIVSSISEFDTTTLYAQIQADLTEFKDVEEADFIEWYEAIKNRIDAITAEMLQDQIDALDSGKADKVSGATNNNFAGLDSNGNLKDSGKKASDFQTALNLSSATATGNPLSFTTDSKQVANNTTVNYAVTQSGSGDPSPSNVRPFVGQNALKLAVPRKNLWSLGDVSGTQQKYFTSGAFAEIPAGTITVSAIVTSADTDSNISRITFYDRTNTTKLGQVDLTRGSRASETITIDQPCGVIYFNASDTKAHGSGDTFSYTDIQIELGETATAYEPYNPITDISILLDETVYGGTWDVESGVLTVTHGRVDMGDLTWTYQSEDTRFRALISDRKAGSSDNVICEIYKTSITASEDDIIWGSANNTRVYVKDTNYNDVSAFRNSVSGHYIVYELATPIVIHLDSHQVKLLQGANVVTTNGTSINLTYRNGNVMTLADTEGLADSIEALNRTWVYDDYVVQGDGTTTWRDLLQLLQPIYNGLTDQEKTYSKIIVRADDPDSNECLTYVGAYWYARDTFSSDGLWGSRVSLEGSCYRSTYMSGTYSDASTTATSSALALRVLRAQENATQIVTSSRSVSNENTKSLPVEENLTKSDTLKIDELKTDELKTDELDVSEKDIEEVGV